MCTYMVFLNSFPIQAYLNAAVALIHVNRSSEALTMIQHIIRKFPDDATTQDKARTMYADVAMKAATEAFNIKMYASLIDIC